MRIAYCEDERAQAVLTEDMIKSWAKERGQKCIVDVFSSAEQFLFELDGEELVPYDLLLLDISMIGIHTCKTDSENGYEYSHCFFDIRFKSCI